MRIVRAQADRLSGGDDDRLCSRLACMTVLVHADEFRAAFGPDPGVLPDGRIEGSDASDWPLVIQTIKGDGLSATWIEDRSPVSDSDVRDRNRASETFAVRLPAGVQVNFFRGDDVVFDIDLREMISQSAVDAICAFIAHIGTACQKSVVLTPEGGGPAAVRFDSTTGDFTLPSAGRA